MGKRIIEGGEIIAKTTDGDMVRGKEVIVEKPDTGTRILSGVLLATGNAVGALGIDATTRERFVESNGTLHKVSQAVHRHEE